MCIASQVLSPVLPFEVHVIIRDRFFQAESKPALWYPTDASVAALNLTRFMKALKHRDIQASSVQDWQREFGELLRLARHDPEFYWRHVIDFMQFQFMRQPDR